MIDTSARLQQRGRPRGGSLRPPRQRDLAGRRQQRGGAGGHPQRPHDHPLAPLPQRHRVQPSERALVVAADEPLVDRARRAGEPGIGAAGEHVHAGRAAVTGVMVTAGGTTTLPAPRAAPPRARAVRISSSAIGVPRRTPATTAPPEGSGASTHARREVRTVTCSTAQGARRSSSVRPRAASASIASRSSAGAAKVTSGRPPIRRASHSSAPAGASATASARASVLSCSSRLPPRGSADALTAGGVTGGALTSGAVDARLAGGALGGGATGRLAGGALGGGATDGRLAGGALGG